MKEITERYGRKFIMFGKYPQTVETNPITIFALKHFAKTNESGYYVYRGVEYEKVTANLNTEIINTSDTYIYGSRIKSLINDKVYYFRVEPIEWKIVREYKSK